MGVFLVRQRNTIAKIPRNYFDLWLVSEKCNGRLWDFLGILRECLKAISKNGKLIATITTISILLKSVPMFSEYYSIKPALRDILTQKAISALSNSTRADHLHAAEHIGDDIQIIDKLGILYFFPSLAIYLFSMVTMIQASVIAYTGRNTSFADSLSRIPNLCLQVLVTLFHYMLSAVGYIGLFFVLFLIVLLPSAGNVFALIAIAVLFCIFALIFFMYLAVVWETALLISVIEESCYGLQAFGEAERLVKGKRLHGLALCLLRFIVLSIFTLSFKFNSNKQSVSKQMIKLFFTNVFICLLDMVYLLSYTVLYFKCKETRGEEVELRGSLDQLQYSKLPEIEVDFGKVPV